MSIFLSIFPTEHIDGLPLGNSPMVFGPHANAEIGYYSWAVKDMYLHLIDLQPQTGTPFVCLLPV